MNIYFNQFSPYAISLGEKMLPVLSNQQKKVAAIISIIVVGFLAVRYALTCYAKKFKAHVKKNTWDQQEKQKIKHKSNVDNKMIKISKVMDHSPKKVGGKTKKTAKLKETPLPVVSKFLMEKIDYQGSNAEIKNVCVRVNCFLDKVKQGEVISNPLEELVELKKEILKNYHDKMLDSENLCLVQLSSIIERLLKYMNISKPEGNFLTLPEDIHKYIFSFVSPKDLGSLHSVSKGIQKVAEDDQVNELVWERVCRQEDAETSKTKTERESWKTFYQEKIDLAVYTKPTTPQNYINVRILGAGNYGGYAVPYNEKAKWIHLKRWIHREHPEIKFEKMNFAFAGKKINDEWLVSNENFDCATLIIKS